MNRKELMQTLNMGLDMEINELNNILPRLAKQSVSFRGEPALHPWYIDRLIFRLFHRLKRTLISLC